MHLYFAENEMALDLHDVRFKLPTDKNALLDALAESAGCEKSVWVRQVIEERLIKELRHFRLIHSELKAIGMLSLLEDGQGMAGGK